MSRAYSRAQRGGSSIISKIWGRRIQPRYGEMGLNALFGYYFKNIADRVGISQMIKALTGGDNGPYAQFTNYMYQHAPNGWADSSLSDSSNKGISTVAGGVATGKFMADSFRGRTSERDINAFGPFALGVWLDPPPGESNLFGMGGGGSSGGDW